VLRHDGSLAKHTGITLQKGSNDGRVYLEVDQNESLLGFSGSDLSDLIIILSWDGDSNPGVLSSSGLNCLDLTSSHAYALILSEFSFEGSCQKSTGFNSSCPSFTIESRIYDARDPTGQRFSASVLTRKAMGGSNVVIPFSNFLRSGPRGKGSFNCAGAVTVTLRFSGFVQLKGGFGTIYTNGEEGAVPTPTPQITVAPMMPRKGVADTKMRDSGEIQGALNVIEGNKLVAATVVSTKQSESENKELRNSEKSAADDEAEATYGEVVR
jgi:hypothetical protein